MIRVCFEIWFIGLLLLTVESASAKWISTFGAEKMEGNKSPTLRGQQIRLVIFLNKFD
jgi:hypothetical protein